MAGIVWLWWRWLGSEWGLRRYSDSSPSVIVMMLDVVVVILDTVLLRGVDKGKLSEDGLELLHRIKLEFGKLKVSCCELVGLISGEDGTLSVRVVLVAEVLTLDFEFWCDSRLCSLADTGRTTFDDPRPRRLNLGVVSYGLAVNQELSAGSREWVCGRCSGRGRSGSGMI